MIAEDLSTRFAACWAPATARTRRRSTALVIARSRRLLRGEMTLEAAVDLGKRKTRQFAKRQLTWFRHEPDVTWVDAPSRRGASSDAVRGILFATFAGKQNGFAFRQQIISTPMAAPRPRLR